MGRGGPPGSIRRGRVSRRVFLVAKANAVNLAAHLAETPTLSSQSREGGHPGPGTYRGAIDRKNRKSGDTSRRVEAVSTAWGSSVSQQDRVQLTIQCVSRLSGVPRVVATASTLSPGGT
eukprot:1837476-Pyramimonas_sp.AAC.2